MNLYRFYIIRFGYFLFYIFSTFLFLGLDEHKEVYTRQHTYSMKCYHYIFAFSHQIFLIFLAPCRVRENERNEAAERNGNEKQIGVKAPDKTEGNQLRAVSNFVFFGKLRKSIYLFSGFASFFTL